MKIRITTLSENTVGPGGLLGEWGLSVLVETEDTCVLLDTGQSISAVHNAGLLGVDLKKIDYIVLSHGHYDHSGGLFHVLRNMRKEVEVIAHPDIWAEKYSRAYGEQCRYIGMMHSPRLLENLGAEFRLSKIPTRISEKIATTGEIPMLTGFESIDPFLVVKDGEGYQPDQLYDDQSLIINTEAGLVVILGCAHRGIINTLYHAQKLTKVRKIHTVIGGCHLIGASDERIRLTVSALKELDVQKLGVSHCTGLKASCIMAREFGDRFFFNNTGAVLELP